MGRVSAESSVAMRKVSAWLLQGKGGGLPNLLWIGLACRGTYGTSTPSRICWVTSALNEVMKASSRGRNLSPAKLRYLRPCQSLVKFRNQYLLRTL